MKERLKVLITVKTYPIPSAKYGELVCTAGVTEAGDFVRLYPINFRDQPYSKQYRKYQWIEVEADRHKTDARKESYRPDNDTLQILGEPIPTKDGDWSERGRFVLPRLAPSMECLRELQEQDGTSLGIIRPKVVTEMVTEGDDREWKSSFLAELRQARLWDDRTVSKQPPRKLPFKFKYKFRCNDSRCKGHEMMNEDWELGALFWKLIDDGASEADAITKVKNKFFTEICGKRNDVHFFVGTVSNHPTSWVVLGTYYPKKQPQKLLF